MKTLGLVILTISSINLLPISSWANNLPDLEFFLHPQQNQTVLMVRVILPLNQVEQKILAQEIQHSTLVLHLQVAKDKGHTFGKAKILRISNKELKGETVEVVQKYTTLFGGYQRPVFKGMFGRLERNSVPPKLYALPAIKLVQFQPSVQMMSQTAKAIAHLDPEVLTSNTTELPQSLIFVLRHLFAIYEHNPHSPQTIDYLLTFREPLLNKWLLPYPQLTGLTESLKKLNHEKKNVQAFINQLQKVLSLEDRKT